MQYYRYEHELELSLYPKEYTLEMALDNGDVVKYGVVPYNAKRMQLFMYNYINNIPDKVVITNYGIDGYPTISILQYTGNEIIYTERDYTNDIVKYYTFYGKSMNEKYRKRGQRLLRDYNLVTLDNKEIPVYIERLGKRLRQRSF